MANKQGWLDSASAVPSRDGGNASAADVPPQDDDFDEEGDPSTSPKKSRIADDGSGAKKKKMAPAAAGIDIAQMEQLLESHSNRILRAQKDNLEGMMAIFEAKTEAKFKHQDDRATATEERVQQVETRLQDMQEKMDHFLQQGTGEGRGSAGDSGLNHLFTLIFGGWNRDTRKQTILQNLDEALASLQLKGQLDDQPFCTGPRRSTALAVFRRRAEENEYQVRKRMHSIIMALAEASIIIPNAKKLFATYSKTREERDIASHASWIKRVVAAVDPSMAGQVDIEYNTGTVWMGDSMIASATRPLAPGADKQHMLMAEDEGKQGWVDVKALAKESKTPEAKLKHILEECRR